MSSEPRRPAAPRGIAVLLILAVGLGILAAVLAHPSAPAPTPTTPGGSGLLAGRGIALDVSVGIMALLFGWLGWEAYVRLRDGRIGFPTRFLVLILALLLLGIAFVVLFHVVSVQIGPGTGGAGAQNSTAGGGSGQPPPNVTQLPNGTLGPLPAPPVGPAGISWVDLGLVALAGSSAVGAILLILYRGTVAEGETDAEAPEPVPALRNELLAALDRMRAEADMDPREAILDLYRRLLAVLEPRLGSVGPYTPREIEHLLVAEAGAAGRPAAELRELFEEARYSTHPMTAAHRDRARQALEEILADFSYRGEVPGTGPERTRAGDPVGADDGGT